MSVFALVEESWEAVIRRVARAEGPVAWSWVASCPPPSEEWELGVLCVRAATVTEKRLLRYREVVIGTEPLSPRAAAKRLREGRVGTTSAVDGTLAFQADRERLLTPYWMTSERDHGWNAVPVDWPQYFVFHDGIGGGSSLSLPWAQLLHAPGMPFYPTVQAAVAECVYGCLPAQVQASARHVLVRLPDHRARLHPARYEDGLVVASVEGGRVDGVRGCVLRATWRSEPGDVVWRRQDIAITGAGEVGIETGAIPAEMWMLLAAPGGQILDRYGWADASVLQPEQRGDVVARVERWIEGGESVQVEFKQQLGEAKVNRSFAETVAAFSNGHGGVILVGVADDRTVVGWDPGDGLDRITTIVRTHVLDFVPVRVDRVEIRGKPVHVVTVPAGGPDAKPYTCDGDVMVRANASTAKASPREIQALTREATV